MDINTTQGQQYQGLPQNARRNIAWFSCGAASAVATKIMIATYPDTLVVRIVVDNEHRDNDRFSGDMEQWFNAPIQKLRSTKYEDCWQVWGERRYLNGPAGALCTVEMKKRVRQAFQKAGDRQCFGYTAEESNRATIFRENNLEVDAVFPLIDTGMRKSDCLDLVASEAYILPLMYRLGYSNANCVGCVKGGKGYWNKIRKDFPEVFDRMALLERQIGASCINGTFLDELKVGAGRHIDIALPECGLFCGEGNYAP
jgi:hypothetical protein